jgi:hypothetical protein
MASSQANHNTSHGRSIQFNGPIHGNVVLAAELQTSFFKTSNYESYKNDPNPARVPGTCEWFLSHPTFRRWKATCKSDLLWLSADPGCGKSVLSRTMIDEKLLGEGSATVCYFFFKDNAEQCSTTTALCALLHQFFCIHESLLQKHVASAVKRCACALKEDFAELWRIFISATTDPSAGGVICVLEALDECRQSDREKLITHLEDFYNDSISRSDQGSRLKFLVTSRPYREIEDKFFTLTQRFPTIRLAGEDESEKISQEIALVIETEVGKIAAQKGLNDKVRIALQNALYKIPNRTYLWLYLTLDGLREAMGTTEKKLCHVIQNTPRTIFDAYEKILERCKGKDTKKILQIVVAARRPLTLSEIDVALAISANSNSYKDLDREGDDRRRKKYIRDSCGLFVGIVDSHVFLIHQTAREFLLQRKDGEPSRETWAHSINVQDAHRVLSEICITHLLFEEFQALYRRIDSDWSHAAMKTSAALDLLEKYDFTEYSAAYWMSHVRVSNIEGGLWLMKIANLCKEPAKWERGDDTAT